MRPPGFRKRLDSVMTERAIDQHGVPDAFGQQGLGDCPVGNQAGLGAPALQPPRDQRGLDRLRRDQHHRLTAQLRCRERFWRLAAGRGEGDRDLEGRSRARLALQRDAAAHALDDAIRDAQAEAGAAIVARGPLVGLLELAKNPHLRVRRNADAGVAHQEADLVGPDSGLDDQRHAAARGELDGIASQIEQHLAQPCGVAHHLLRQAFVDIGRYLELLGLRARGQQFGDILHEGDKGERPLLEIDLAGLDLGVVEQLLDQRQQRVAGGLDRPDIGGLLRRQRGIEQ